MLLSQSGLPQSGNGSFLEVGMGHVPGAAESGIDVQGVVLVPGTDSTPAYGRSESECNKTADHPMGATAGDSWRSVTERERGEEAAFPQAKRKKTRGRVKIEIKFIQEKFKRLTTFSKRKKYIIKKAEELATLTGTQVLVLAASETGHIFRWATPKFQPIIADDQIAQIEMYLKSSDVPLQNDPSTYPPESPAGFQVSETEGQGHTLDASLAGNSSSAQPLVQHTTTTTMQMSNRSYYPVSVMPPNVPYPYTFIPWHHNVNVPMVSGQQPQ